MIAKMDAASEKTFRRINKPFNSIRLEKVIDDIKETRGTFKGSFRLQLMLLEENMGEAGDMADLCREIDPDIVYINTPLRPCMAKPLSREDMESIVPLFRGLKVEVVYG